MDSYYGHIFADLGVFMVTCVISNVLRYGFLGRGSKRIDVSDLRQV